MKEEHGGRSLFTRKQSQLEAYRCATGKVLLAGSDKKERARYLHADPFVALTARAVVDADVIGAVIRCVGEQAPRSTIMRRPAAFVASRPPAGQFGQGGRGDLHFAI